MSESKVKEPEVSSLENLAAVVDACLEAVREMDEESRNKATALKEALEAFHKEGLVALVKMLKADPRGKELLVQALDNPAIYALFSMHGIIKKPLTARVLEVLELIKPTISAHGGAIELVRIEDDVAYVRLHGACAGCSMSAQTLRGGVEEALRARVPEISRVEQVQDMAVSGFLTIENATGNSSKPEDSGWVQGPLAQSVTAEKLFHFAEANAVIALLDGKLFAYRNSCPHMGQPLHDGCLENGTLTCGFHGFKFQLSTGECLTAAQVQLEPFPLKVVDGRVWVRPA